MGHVITIYNHGTGDDDSCKESIVTILHNETGQGQREDLVKERSSVFYRGVDHSVIVTQGVGSGMHGSGMSGNLYGADIETNVGPVVDRIEKLLEEVGAIDCINMCGWSRGGVTCFKQANLLAKSNKPNVNSIPVRIFAIDPVPGCAGESNAHMYKHIKILDNVKECVIIIAESERRNTFRPVFPPNFLGKAECTWDCMPGNHSQVAKVKPNESPGKIVKGWAKEFLTESKVLNSRWGLGYRTLTPFIDSRLMEAGEYLSLYAKMMMDEYEGMMKHGAEFSFKGLVDEERGIQEKTISNKALVLQGKEPIKSTQDKYHRSKTLNYPPCRVFTNRHHTDLFGAKYPGYVAVMSRVQGGNMVSGDYNLLTKFHDHDGRKSLLHTDWLVVKKWFYWKVLQKVGMGTAVEQQTQLGVVNIIDNYTGSNIDRY